MEDAPQRADKPRSWRTYIPAPLRHGITIFVALLVIEYFVVPRFVVASHSIGLLRGMNVFWLPIAILLEAASLFSYALLTQEVLPKDGPSLGVLTRIDLSTTAIAHVIPGGSAGSAGLGYRLFTSYGVTGPDAAFAMATQGMGSAVVLNVLLWICLVLSIPLAGAHFIYVIVALIGMLAMIAVAAVVYALTKGEDSAARFVAKIAGRFPRLSEERMTAGVRHISTALRSLGKDRHQLRRAMLWAASNWLLDAACLWAFLAAFHYYVDPIELFAAYGIANVLAVIPVTPGGLGFVEASSVLLLTSFGVPKGVATLGVLGWRLVNFWLPIPVGTACYVSLRVQRGGGLRQRRQALSTMATEARTVIEVNPDDGSSGDGGSGDGSSGDGSSGDGSSGDESSGDGSSGDLHANGVSIGPVIPGEVSTADASRKDLSTGDASPLYEGPGHASSGDEGEDTMVIPPPA